MDLERRSRQLHRINKPRRSYSSNAVSLTISNYDAQSFPVTRSLSATHFKDYEQIVRDKYSPVPYLSKFYRDRVGTYNKEYEYDRFSLHPKFWPTIQRSRHYRPTDPSYNYYFYYPAASIYPKYNKLSYSDNLDPTYWRHYRDPYYDQPLWFPYRPWVYESNDARRGIDMFKRKLITYDSLQKYWMTPYMNEKKYNDLKYTYRPLYYHTYPRRYSYFYDIALY